MRDRRNSPTGTPAEVGRVQDPSVGLLRLQRAAGNAAVARLVRTAVPAVQRSTVASVPASGDGWHEVPGIRICYGSVVDPLIDTKHHWIEIFNSDNGGDESYGWWPSRVDGQVDIARVLLGPGLPGVVNATTLPIRRSATVDPHHGDSDARRHAVLAPGNRTAAELAPAIRAFTQSFRAVYSWNPFGVDCQEFIEELLAAVGLRVGRMIGPKAVPAPAQGVNPPSPAPPPPVPALASLP